MAALTSTKRPFDPIEDSLSPDAKKLRCAARLELKAERDSPAAPSPGIPRDHDTEDTEDDRQVFTVRYLEIFKRKPDTKFTPGNIKCRGGPLAGRYDYRRWAREMGEIFETNGLKEAIEGKLVALGQLAGSPFQAELVRVHTIARHIINSNVNESSRASLHGIRCSQETWEKLRKLYQLSPSEMSLEGWGLIKEKRISHYTSAIQYTTALEDAWRQVCMDQDDMFKQTQPMLCTALLHGLDGFEWSLWKNTILANGDIATDFEKLADKVKDQDPLIRSKSRQRPMLK